jgi:hypothetical protein
MEREKSLLPSTLNEVIKEKERRKINIEIKELEEHKKRLYDKIRTVNKQIRHKIRDSHNLLYKQDQPRKFIRKCPNGDCRGFLTTQWNCELCNSKICNKCNEVKNEIHICNEDSVKTMELLKTDTKPCPNCATMIYKIDGCDQMYCIDCNTAFSWITGRIEKGTIHNPHYYDFIRRTNGGVVPRNPHDNPCDNTLIDYYYFYSVIRKFNVVRTFIPFLERIHNTTQHIIQVVLRKYTIPDNNNVSLRISYLLNEMNEETWKKKLQIFEKSREKNRDFHQLYTMFTQTSIDQFSKLHTLISSTQDKDLVFRETKETLYIFNELVTYLNEESSKIGKRYNCVYGGISNMFEWKDKLTLI